MKKSGILLILLLSIYSGAKAQNIDDALRYSQIFYSGSARFMSMGGAFTALGEIYLPSVLIRQVQAYSDLLNLV